MKSDEWKEQLGQLNNENPVSEDNMEIPLIELPIAWSGQSPMGSFDSADEGVFAARKQSAAAVEGTGWIDLERLTDVMEDAEAAESQPLAASVEEAEWMEEEQPVVEAEETERMESEQPVIAVADGNGKCPDPWMEKEESDQTAVVSDKAESSRMGSKQNKKRKRVIAAATAAACFLLSISFAWYKYISHRSVYSEEREVMVPYYLYLLNSTSTDYFQLNVVNMHPEETKRVVFCVSNEDIDNQLVYAVGRNSDFNYELELTYTQNIPLSYTIYALDELTEEEQNAYEEMTDEQKAESDMFETKSEIPKKDENGNVEKDADGKVLYITKIQYWKKRKSKNSSVQALTLDTTESDEETKNNNKELYGDDYNEAGIGIVNIGKYDVYPDDVNGDALRLQTEFHGTHTEYPKHYYLIEVDWAKDRKEAFSDYLKETDLIYVIVRAKQPRPEKSTTEATAGTP